MRCAPSCFNPGPPWGEEGTFVSDTSHLPFSMYCVKFLPPSSLFLIPPHYLSTDWGSSGTVTSTTHLHARSRCHAAWENNILFTYCGELEVWLPFPWIKLRTKKTKLWCLKVKNKLIWKEKWQGSVSTLSWNLSVGKKNWHYQKLKITGPCHFCTWGSDLH